MQLLQSVVLLTTLVLLLTTPDAHGHAHAVGHTCIHDKLVARHLEKHGADAFDAPPSIVSYAPKEGSSLLPDSAPAHAQVREFARGVLRFHIDTTALTGDSRTCETASGFVAVGTPAGPGNTPVCATAAQDDCYIACVDENVLSADKRNQITNVLIPAATQALSDALDVIQLAGPLKVAAEGTSECSIRDPVPIPDLYTTGAGVNNADIVLLVTGRPTAGTLLAYAGACRVDQFNRPIMAHINFNPGNVTVNPSIPPTELGTAIHELLHGLGFTAAGRTGFGKFLNLADNSTRPYSQVVGATLNVGASNPYSNPAINTTRALAETRAHFGCSSLSGVPLEQQGGSGTELSHWEKRVFWDEMMTGTSSANPKMSRITLALMEDSGWYTAKMAGAQDFTYGKNLGCSFLEEKCTPSNWPPRYVCAENNVRGCNYDRSARARCTILSYTSGGPDATMQYFSDTTLGGADSIADFCPVYIEFSNGVCSQTSNADPANDPFFGQVWSRDSVCIDSAIGLNQGSESIRCYRSGCTSASVATVNVGVDWTPCSGGETGLSSSGFPNTWNCPESSWVAAKCGDISSFPTLTAVSLGSPDTSLALAGNQAVTLTGSGFTADMTVVLGALPCSSVLVTSPTEATCTTLPPPALPESVQKNIPSGAKSAAIIRADGSAAVLESAITVTFPSAGSVTSPRALFTLFAPLLAFFLTIMW